MNLSSSVSEINEGPSNGGKRRGMFGSFLDKLRVPGKNYYAPKWIVLLIDMGFSLASAFIALLLTMSFSSSPLSVERLGIASLVVVCVRIGTFLIKKTYSGIVRYTGSRDVLSISYALTTGEVLLLVTNLVLYLVGSAWMVPFVFLWIEFSMLLCMMVFSRLIFKLLFAQNFHIHSASSRKNVFIYGNDDYLFMVKHVLNNATTTYYNIEGFIDVNHKSAGKLMSGIRVYHPNQLPTLLQQGHIDSIFVAPKLLDSTQKKELMDFCIKNKVEVKEVPNLEKVVGGIFTENNIRNIHIEDLLERDAIELDDKHISEQVKGKHVLVTGAAGSIGSEIVRQLTGFHPKMIILLDIAESALYDLELELAEKYNFTDFTIELGDIRNKTRLRGIFKKYHPDIIYHAAAYKHVPMIERLPIEGADTNIFGTKNVADLASEFGCGKFVMISTDKAVNPTNVMGCTKRIAEIYIQSLNAISSTAFITTRFGNVLGSSGSVIPRFARQIEEGGPVTVTHPEITRFFMTIPEACQLVLQAGALGYGGEIFAFDMGDSIRIADLAKNMIRLSGYNIGQDIKIVYTGLRPGEKLYEEVLSDREKVLPTIHKRINRAQVLEYDFDYVQSHLVNLREIVKSRETFDAVRVMKVIVPEFKSRNSVFEEIDRELERENASQPGHPFREYIISTTNESAPEEQPVLTV